MKDKNMFECQKECNKNPNCNSIKFCGGENLYYTQGCTLYDQIITKSTPQVILGSNCTSAFKTCPGGIFLFIEPIYHEVF